MDSFYTFSIIRISAVLSLQDEEDDSLVDIVGELPPEVASIILRHLDGKSLVSASMVSRAWKRLCYGDGELTRRIKAQREHLRRLREAENRVENVLVLRDGAAAHGTVFKDRNERYAVVRKEDIDTIYFSPHLISPITSPTSPRECPTTLYGSPTTPKSRTKKKKPRVVTPIRL